MVKGMLNKNTPLDEAVIRLGKSVTAFCKKMAEAERESFITIPRGIDRKGFHLVLGHITLQAIDRIRPE